MRGKASKYKQFVKNKRITHAYAGKSGKTVEFRGCDKDHPRLCGEKINSQSVNKRLEGSPPPMRGKVDANFPIKFDFGITPAYAGKSHSHPCANHCI